MSVDPFRRAVAHLARFPGVGEKTATRYAYWLLRQPPEVAAGIAEAVLSLRASVHECSRCRDLSSDALCRRCADTRRDAATLCVVERPQDINALDGAGTYKGAFHVLHGALSPLDGVGPAELRVRELLARIGGVDGLPPVAEVILATDPDVEGDATALYVARLLKPLGVRVTRLAHGVSVGTEIEFADRVSLARALEGRREM
ncbi:MAG: recombination mediator RecR [Pseudomonadota bacterium]|nr:recombination mediator RecR [Pseudomonadota bacterium]